MAVERAGVDSEPEATARVRRRAAEEGRRVEIHAGDARDLDRFADGAIDVVVSTLTLHHLAPGDAARALAEIDRVAAVNFFVFDLRRTLGSLSAAWAFLHLGGVDPAPPPDGPPSLRPGDSAAPMPHPPPTARPRHAARPAT